MTDMCKSEMVIRLCRHTIDRDPGSARGWALPALAPRIPLDSGKEGDSGLVAADRALALDATLAEVHAAKIGVLIPNNQGPRLPSTDLHTTPFSNQ